jgi:hypothetical protein
VGDDEPKLPQDAENSDGSAALEFLDFLDDVESDFGPELRAVVARLATQPV